jgi:paraquat-inducible protein B
MVYVSVRDRGTTITVSFESAEGLEPGKTKVKHKDVALGTVTGVRLAPDLARILVSIQMDAGAEGLLHEGTAFWIVRPRIGAGGVSGLSTLISGAFIEIDPATSGADRRDFVGLEEPPLIRSMAPGTRFVLHAERLGGLSRGAPIYHRGVEVGQVLGYQLDTEQRRISVPIFVQAPHDRLVTTATRFWDASGVRVGTGAAGIEVQLASLQSLLLGGIEFDDAPGAVGATRAPAETDFPLYDDRASAVRASLTKKLPMLVEFEGETRGLRPGAAVETRGLRIGTVGEVRLAWHEGTNGLVIQALIEVEPERVTPIDAETGAVSRARTLEELVASGMRAQLRTASLLTGELYVDLDFHPEAPVVAMRTARGLPVVPSVPTELETLSASLSGVLEKVAALPLGPLVEELRGTVRAIGDVTRGQKMTAALDSLASTLDALQRIAASAEEQTPGLMRSLRQAADQARDGAAALEQLLGAESRTRADLTGLLREAAAAARALRGFAELLQRHPEALLRGRAGGER